MSKRPGLWILYHLNTGLVKVRYSDDSVIQILTVLLFNLKEPHTWRFWSIWECSRHRSLVQVRVQVHQVHRQLRHQGGRRNFPSRCHHDPLVPVCKFGQYRYCSAVTRWNFSCSLKDKFCQIHTDKNTSSLLSWPPSRYVSFWGGVFTLKPLHVYNPVYLSCLSS